MTTGKIITTGISDLCAHPGQHFAQKCIKSFPQRFPEQPLIACFQCGGNWIVLPRPTDACVNACPGQCLCQLDTNLNPFCNCPGSSCSNLMCFAYPVLTLFLFCVCVCVRVCVCVCVPLSLCVCGWVGVCVSVWGGGGLCTRACPPPTGFPHFS